MSFVIFLPHDATLKGQDLSGAYLMAKTQPDPEQFHMFKKKESVATMPKSLLKHKIQNLTGKTLSDIEEEMGFPSTRDGGGIPVEVLRRLAHFLILQTVDKLEVPPELLTQPVVNEVKENLTVRPGRRSLCQPSPSPLENGTPKRATRRSVAPELLRNTTVTENVACRLKPRANHSNQSILEETQEEEILSDQDLGIGENPTPMMIALKRKSLAAGAKPVAAKMENKTPSKVVQKTVSPPRSRRAENEESRPTEKLTAIESTNEFIQESLKKGPKAPRMDAPSRFSPVSQHQNIPVSNPRFSASSAPRPEFPGSKGCKIFLVEGYPINLEYNDILRVAPNFKGTNLAVLHTPVEWDPVRILKFVLEIKRINEKAKMECYLVMIGCGIQNAKIVQDALLRQTRYVQFLVFDREDAGFEDHVEGVKLREATSYFLLAYFFPECQVEGSQPPVFMVRPGFSTCFRPKSAEDLENKILKVLSEEDDWILDVFCRNRELSLAAQKTGRNLIAIDPSRESLDEIKAKAQAVALHYDQTFRPGVDGSILTL